MKIEILKIAQDLEEGMITERDAETLLLGLFSVTKRFSYSELENVLGKPKLVLISPDLENILLNSVDKHYNIEDDGDFIRKYAGKKVLVYEWCGDWWICEDDNYVITKDCFTEPI
jgi:hypothetical protein